MSSCDIALVDEREALNSIYGSDTLTLTSSNNVAVLRLPDLPYSFRLLFPADYPDSPPTVEATHSVGSSARGEGEFAVNVLRDVLGHSWTPGQVCLFDLIEEASPLLQQHDHAKTQDDAQNAASRSASQIPVTPSNLTADTVTQIAAPDWILSEPSTFNKSTFVARACHISSLPEAKDAITHLITTNKKVAGATHNITAWRIQSKVSDGNFVTTIQDCDDDGEAAAGGRLLHLMQLMDVWNVVVCVTRWYGGVKLGPDRFRLINSVAREVLLKGGFAQDESEKGKTKGKKK